MKSIHAERAGQPVSYRPVSYRPVSRSIEPTASAAVRPAAVESLEPRRHLSAAPAKGVATSKLFPPAASYVAPKAAAPKTIVQTTPKAVPIAGSKLTAYLARSKGRNASPLGAAGPVGLTPTQVRHAYGVDAVSFGGITGDGAGQTIAIIVAYDNPKLVSSTDPNYATSDLALFNAAMGLPDPPSFTKLDQTGGTNLPTATDPAWAAEAAMNVEWAHAMAPKASIVLIEAKSANYADLITAAANTARNLPGVSVVSMSFGTDGGFFNENVYDQYFTTPAGHQGVTFVAASGDHGAVLSSGATTATGNYPAESPNVVAVGGTALTLSADDYASETGWTGSGGGISRFENKPAYQSAVTQSSTKRTIPDVSITASPTSGVAVYDSFNNPTAGEGWYSTAFYGTSVGAPMWAGLIAVTNQARAANGLGTLAGSSQTLPRLYQVAQSHFHDVTTGNNKYDGVNGFTAAAGYDLVTGRGTPIANTLLQSLAGGTVSGSVYVDKNSDGIFNNTDVVGVGVTIYADGNNNGSFDAGEISTTTAANGTFTLDAPAGLPVRVGPGYLSLSTSNPIATTTYGTLSGLVVPVFPTTYTNSGAGTRSMTLRFLSGTSATQITITNVINGTTTNDFYAITATKLPRIDFVSAGNTTLTIDQSFGIALLTTPNTYTAAAGDTVIVKSPSGGSTVTFANTGITIGSRTMSFIGTAPAVGYTGGSGADNVTLTNVATPFAFPVSGGADSVTVNGGTPTITTDLGNTTSLTANSGTTTLSATQHLSSLAIVGSAAVKLHRPAAVPVVIRTPSLSINSAGGAALDLEDNGLVLDYTTSSSNAAAAAWLASGYAAGAWTGSGIRSSTAAADAAKSHAVGSGEASTALGLSASATGTFLTESVDATTVLVRTTLYGDANLSGGVDFNDFLAVQNNFAAATNTFAQGNFNYDPTTDFNDFLLLQNNFGLLA